MDVIRLSMTSHSPTPSPRSMENEEEGDPPNEDLLRILSEAKEGPVIEVDLKGRGLTNIPDAVGRISTIVSLDLSENKLKVNESSMYYVDGKCHESHDIFMLILHCFAYMCRSYLMQLVVW